jgi:hypothetical protein
MAWGTFKIPQTTYSHRVGDLLSEIQRHMLEPTIDEGISWQLWTSNEVLNYLRERIAKFLVETGLVIDRTSVTMVAGTALYDLDSTLAELRRVGVDSRGLTICDYWEQDHGTPGWERLSGTPTGYLVNPINQLTIQLDPVPNANGTLRYHYIRSTPFENPNTITDDADFTIYDYVVRVPSNFCWTTKKEVIRFDISMFR